jgi:hypothetical protein
MSNFIKNCPLGFELIHVDKRTDMKKLIVAFRSFVNAPKKVKGSPNCSTLKKRSFLTGVTLGASRSWGIHDNKHYCLGPLGYDTVKTGRQI